MKELKIKKNEAGQRLDKYLAKYMKKAPRSFFYKMMRKKNITLNGKKAEGSEILTQGDSIKLFLSDDTIRKFSSDEISGDFLSRVSEKEPLDIIYEDAHMIFINKPSGILSQKAAPDDISLVEHLIAYLIRTGQITEEELHTFHPSVCNRLDRNTSGIVAAGKSLEALQQLSAVFRERSVEKYYLCLVSGEFRGKKKIAGWLTKNRKTNHVTVEQHADKDAVRIETEYRSLSISQGLTLMEVHLITGKTHQIRAHLASEGFPIIGDYKYGNYSVNERFRKEYGLKSQLLHAYRLCIPDINYGPISALSGKELKAPLSHLFSKILNEKGLRI